MSQILIVDCIQNDFFKLGKDQPGLAEKRSKIASEIAKWDGYVIVPLITFYTKEQVDSGWPLYKGTVPYEDSECYKNLSKVPVYLKGTEGHDIHPDLLPVLQAKNKTKCRFRTVILEPERPNYLYDLWKSTLSTYEVSKLKVVAINTMNIQEHVGVLVHLFPGIPVEAIRV